LRLRNQADSIILANKNYHQRDVTIMAQSILPFKYKNEKTALAGLPAYLDLAKV